MIYLTTARTYLELYKSTGERHYLTQAREQIKLYKFEKMKEELANFLKE